MPKDRKIYKYQLVINSYKLITKTYKNVTNYKHEKANPITLANP